MKARRYAWAVALVVVVLAGGAALVVSRRHERAPETPTVQLSMADLRVQARADLDRYESQLAQVSGGGGFIPVGELTGQIGNWEAGNDNHKDALRAGMIVADAPLPDAPHPTATVTWDGGATATVALISADEALTLLHSSGGSPCDSCTPLHVTSARLMTVRINTTRGQATVPAWEYTLAGTSVRLTRVAVSAAATFVYTPPSGDPYHTPPGDSIEAATVSSSGLQLTVSFIGTDPTQDPDAACGVRYEAETMESANAVVVLLLSHPAPPPPRGFVCSGDGYERTMTVTLPSPLAGRAVLEVREGMPVPVTVIN